MAEIEELKALFGTEALTYDQLNAKLTAAGSDKVNLVNLAKGGYISTEKHARELDDARKAAGSDKVNLVNLAKGGYISTEKHARELDDARKAAGTASVPADYEELKAKAAFEKKYNDLVAENERKERLGKVTATGEKGGNVRAEFADFVLSEVEKTVTDKKDFDTALAEYVKAHPQYTSKQKNVVRLGSGVKEKGGNGEGEKKGGWFNDLLLGNLDT